MVGTGDEGKSPRLAIIGASGKLANAALRAILSNKLYPASSIVATTSATSPDSPQWKNLSSQGVTVRHATFDDESSIRTALEDVDRVLLVSSPRIAMDFHDAPPGQGREKDHFTAIRAAQAAGVKHLYYTSLAFGRPSKAGVMVAHIRTEEYLEKEVKGMAWTVIREGLYNESWPLYLGHWKLGKDERSEVCIAGDSKISWTSIADLGLATALVLAAPSEEYAGQTFYLSNTREAKSMAEVAALVSKGLNKDVRLKIVEKPEHEAFYVNERGMDDGLIKWWVETYDALRDEECLIKDDTFEKLLKSRGKEPDRMEDTIRNMIKGA